MRLAVLCLMGVSLLVGAGPSGTWDCTATTPNGEDHPFTLKVAKTEGKLEVIITGDQGDIKVPDPKLEGDTLEFRIQVDAGSFEIRMNFKGDVLEGTWKGTEVDGKMKGKRR